MPLPDSLRPLPKKRRAAPPPRADAPGLTIVTPSYEGHYQQFARLLESVREHCRDPHLLTYVVIVEKANVERFRRLFRADEAFAYRIMTTEEALLQFDIDETAAAFLKRAGKFTFQTLKKFVGLYNASTRWSLVLDSETIFLNPFSVADLMEDYAQRKYVFYSRTGPRGHDWDGSLGRSVLLCCSAALSMQASDRWYMEYFHWFYETDKLRDMVDNHLNSRFHADIKSGTDAVPYFEVILYYMYLEKVHASEYRFHDIFDEVAHNLPAEIAGRFIMAELPFSRFGNEYLLNVLRPEEVGLLSSFFEAHRLPFLRLEPPVVSHRYIEEARKLPGFRALISSQHVAWLQRKIAVCVTDGFSDDERVLDAQLRELIGFLSGVECDLYVHGRPGADETAICETLQVAGARFEDAPMLEDLLEQVAAPPPHEPERDLRHLHQLWSAQRCHELIPEAHDYGIIVRTRPGLVHDLSLKEILFAISEDSDVLPDTLYLPRALHARGVNLDLAIGPPKEMRTYMRAFGNVFARRADYVFDGNVALLETLFEGGCRFALAEMAYSDMGEDMPGIDDTHRRFHHQFANWWGRNEDLPLHKDVSPYFASKLAAVQLQLRGSLPAVFEADLPDGTTRIGVKLDGGHPAAQVTTIRRSPRTAEPDWNGHVYVTRSAKGIALTRWTGIKADAPILLKLAS